MPTIQAANERISSRLSGQVGTTEMSAWWTLCRRRHNVHLIRASLRYVPRRDYDVVVKDLRATYIAIDSDRGSVLGTV